MVNDKQSFFTKTPALKPCQVLNKRNANFSYPLKNTTSAHFQNTYRGESFETLTQLNDSYNDKEKSRLLRKYIIEHGFQPDEIKMEEAHRDSTNLSISYSATSNKVYKEFGNDILIKILPFVLPILELPEERRFPIQVDFPIFKIDELVYEIPKGSGINGSLENKNIESKFGSYSISYEEMEGHVNVTKLFRLNRGNYSLKEYPEFYNFLNTVTKLENKTYITTTKNH